MIASFFSGFMGILIAISVNDSSMLVISAPGFVIGAFFAFKYAMFDRTKRKEEEHRRSRRQRKH
jgi:hypothetical protein